MSLSTTLHTIHTPHNLATLPHWDSLTGMLLTTSGNGLAAYAAGVADVSGTGNAAYGFTSEATASCAVTARTAATVPSPICFQDPAGAGPRDCPHGGNGAICFQDPAWAGPPPINIFLNKER